MPHRYGESYLMGLIESGCSEIYQNLIQMSPIRYMAEPPGPIDGNKKLLVLGLNGTLCDIPDLNEDFTPESARPYLHMFLKRVTEYFNIFIWSSDSLDDLLIKADILNIRNSNDFPIAAYLDKTLMQTVISSHFIHPKKVKNLEVICGKNDFFQLADIIMVDSILWNFLGNPENGIVISPYNRNNHDEDEELFKLAAYLEALARQSGDFRKVKHKNWKEVGNGIRTEE